MLLQDLLQFVNLVLLSFLKSRGLERNVEEILREDIAFKGFHFKADQRDDGRRNPEDFLILVEDEEAVVGGDLDVESNDRGHAGLHRVVILAPAFHLDQVPALMRHVEGFLLIGRTQEILNAFLELLSEQQLQRSVQDLVPLIPKKRGAAGVSINNDPMIGLINADKHDGAAAVGPILQNYLLL